MGDRSALMLIVIGVWGRLPGGLEEVNADAKRLQDPHATQPAPVTVVAEGCQCSRFYFSIVPLYV